MKFYSPGSEIQPTTVTTNSKLLKMVIALQNQGIKIPISEIVARSETLKERVEEDAEKSLEEFINHKTAAAKYAREEIVNSLKREGVIPNYPNVLQRYQEKLEEWKEDKIKKNFVEEGSEIIADLRDKLLPLEREVRKYKNVEVVVGPGVKEEDVRTLVLFSQAVEKGLMRNLVNKNEGERFLEQVYSERAKEKIAIAKGLLGTQQQQSDYNQRIRRVEVLKDRLERSRQKVDIVAAMQAEKEIRREFEEIDKLIEKGLLPSRESYGKAIKLLQEAKLGLSERVVTDRGSVPLTGGKFEGVKVRNVPISYLLSVVNSERDPKYEELPDALRGIIQAYLDTPEGERKVETEYKRREQKDKGELGFTIVSDATAEALKPTPRTGRKEAEEYDLEHDKSRELAEQTELVRFLNATGPKVLERDIGDKVRHSEQAVRMYGLIHTYLDDPKAPAPEYGMGGRLNPEIVEYRKRQYYKLRAKLLPDWKPHSDKWFQGESKGIYIAYNKILDMIERLDPGSSLEDIYRIQYEIERLLKPEELSAGGLNIEALTDVMSDKLRDEAHKALEERISILNLVKSGEVLKYDPSEGPLPPKSEDLEVRKKLAEEYMENLSDATSSGIESDVQLQEVFFEVGGNENYASAGYEVRNVEIPLNPPFLEQKYSTPETEEEYHLSKLSDKNEEELPLIKTHQTLRRLSEEG